MFTVKEMAEAIGKQGTIVMEGLHVNVRIQDVKQNYGDYRLLIHPLAGDGEIWVDVRRVNFTHSSPAATHSLVA